MPKSLKAKLKEGKPLIGTLVSLPSPEIAEVLTDAGFDWLFVDMEHGLLGYADAQRIIQTAGASCPCLVRVPANDSTSISKALDTGAAGLIFPHINGAEEARDAVRAAKYPPQGTRSVGLARAQGYGAFLKESFERDNQETVLVAQAEHIDAAVGIENIISVAGLDAVFIGPFDLSASLNKPGQLDDEDVKMSIKKIRDACALAHLPTGILARNLEAARRFLHEGYRLICISSDTMLLGDTARQILSSIRFL
jgi:2-keto-3-deoxy-L-rhamnonate aldolase RhmA